ncbi:MAG: flagellin [Deltaproteobacteria bacterium]|nr:flagellin [Deltaproteobacteria bacterium]
MALRINNNLTGMRTLRQMSTAERNLAESLLRLSSGFRINQAKDDPAGLVISEQMRGQIVGLNQAIANAEVASTMVQTAEASLNESNKLLLRMRELALHASNEGANDIRTVEADQLEIQDVMQALERIGQSAEFGHRKLLDGSTGSSGEAQGEGLLFLSAGPQTQSSPTHGFPVEVTRVATRAYLDGTEPLDSDILPNLTVTVFESGHSIQIKGQAKDTPSSFHGRLRSALLDAGLKVDVVLNEDYTLSFRHQNYGSAYTFQASGSEPGVVSEVENELQAAVPGVDIAGTLNQEPAMGRGQTLTGIEGNRSTQGLTVRYSGPLVDLGFKAPDGTPVLIHQPTVGMVGSVNVFNNSLQFQVGADANQTVSVQMPLIRPGYMGREVETKNPEQGLAGISVRTPESAREAIRVIDAAIGELTLNRGRLGAFQRNSLESHLATMRVAVENITAAESTVRDTDIARELAEYTRNRILLDTSTAMAAQANQVQEQVIRLIQ